MRHDRWYFPALLGLGVVSFLCATLLSGHPLPQSVQEPELPPPGTVRITRTDRAPVDLRTIVPEPEKRPSSLHPYLERVIAQWQRGGAMYMLRGRGRTYGFRWMADRVLVRVIPQPRTAGHLRDALARIPDVRVHTAHPESLEVWVPIHRLEMLRTLPGVRQVTIPRWVRPMVTSEGYGIVGAPVWRDLPRLPGLEGTPRIGIVDIGFRGYTGLLGNELPPSSQVHTRNFRFDQDFESTEHGTAVAEIVADFNRQVDLYLAAIATSGELAEAIAWMREQGVQVISGSIGITVRAGNGCCSPEYPELDRAARDGIVPVFAAGNEALSHWYAPDFADSDGDRWLNFSGRDELNCFPVLAGDTTDITLIWYDWPATTRDYDLYVMTPGGRIVGASLAAQTGQQEPFEYLSIQSDRDRTLCVAIRRFSGPTGVPVELFIFSSACGGTTPCFEYTVPDYSIIEPADGRNVVAVGAVVWNTDRLAPYSSRGPTLDGRLKPDISAPTHVRTVSYGSFLFTGTSAATPHVTGAISLMHYKVFTQFSGQTIYQILVPRSIDLGPKGPDRLYGVGRLYMLIR